MVVSFEYDIPFYCNAIILVFPISSFLTTYMIGLLVKS